MMMMSGHLFWRGARGDECNPRAVDHGEIVSVFECSCLIHIHTYIYIHISCFCFTRALALLSRQQKATNKIMCICFMPGFEPSTFCQLRRTVGIAATPPGRGAGRHHLLSLLLFPSVFASACMIVQAGTCVIKQSSRFLVDLWRWGLTERREPLYCYHNLL